MNLFKQVFRVMRRCNPFTNGMYGEEEIVCVHKEWTWETLPLLFLLAVRRTRREHIRTMSKNADNGCSLKELSTFHPCFITIFTVSFLKRRANSITGHSACQAVLSRIPGLNCWLPQHVSLEQASRRWCYLPQRHDRASHTVARSIVGRTGGNEQDKGNEQDRGGGTGQGSSGAQYSGQDRGNEQDRGK